MLGWQRWQRQQQPSFKLWTAIVASTLPMVLMFWTGSSDGAVRMSKPRWHPKNPYIDAMLVAERRLRSSSSVQYKFSSAGVRNWTAVCYDQAIGCFFWNETNPLIGLPGDPGMKGFNVTFNLYDPSLVDSPIVLLYEDESTYKDIGLLKDTNRTLYVLVHGFGGSSNSDWVTRMRDDLIKLRDTTVMAVDWRQASALPLYHTAMANTLSVSRATGYILAEIVRKYNYPPANIHLIGFSMGAHVAGFAGRHFKKLTGAKIGRLTVLDPASPGFEAIGLHVKKEDSDFTVGVHTSAGNSILIGRVGMVDPVGHVDFYPNGGSTQPGCFFLDVACHHERAFEYFLEMVESAEDENACRFKANHCLEDLDQIRNNNCTVKEEMVGELSLTSRGSGIMYFKTNTRNPFCVMYKGNASAL